MTSRELARVSVRLIGLGFLATVVTGGYLRSLLAGLLRPRDDGYSHVNGPWAAYFAALVAGGLFLVIRGATVADRFGIGEGPRSADEETEVRSADAGSVLFAVGAIVLGVLMFVDAIEPSGRVVAYLASSAPRQDGQGAAELWRRHDRDLLDIVLRVAGGLALVLGLGRARCVPPTLLAPAQPRPTAAAMTTGALGRVLLRLAGVVLLVACVMTISVFVVFLASAGGSAWHDANILMVLAPILIVASGLFLLRQADWIATKCSIGSDVEPFVAPLAPSADWSPEAARRVGLVTVGVLALVDAVGHLVAIVLAVVGRAAPEPSSFERMLSGGGPPHTSLAWNAVLTLVYAAAGMLLILTPRRVGRWLRSTFLMPRSSDTAERS